MPTGKVKKLVSLIDSPRKISTVMGIIKLMRAFAGFITVILSANYFGAGIERDTWILGGSVAAVLLQAFFGPVNDIIRTKFLHVKHKSGEAKALSAFSSLFSFFLIVSLGIVGFCLFDSNGVSQFFAPGFKDAHTMHASAAMIRYLIPGLVISEMVILFISILNCYDSFFIPDIIFFISAIITNVLIICFVKMIGIHVLIISNYIGLLLLVTALFGTLIKKNIKIRIKIPVWSEFAPYLVFAMPFYIVYIASQINISVEKALTTNLGVGNTSILDYARKFSEVPTSTFVAVATSVLTPVLAQKWIEGNKKGFETELSSFLNFGVLLITPIIVLFTICRIDIVTLLLLRGDFSADLVQPVAHSLSYFGAGLYGAILYIILGQALVTQGKVKLFAVFGMLMQLFPTLLNFLFYKKFGVVFFAMSSGIATLLFSLIMIYFTRVFSKDTSVKLVKYSLLLVVSFVLSGVVKMGISSDKHLLSIILVVLTCGSSMVAMLFVLKLQERLFITRFLNNIR